MDFGSESIPSGAQLSSACDPAHYMWMKKSQNMPVWLSKMILAQHFLQFNKAAGTRDRKAVHVPAKREECNKNMI